ncbi:conserved membrane hypothetical protein [metagenome]|uniref:Integral membrane protein n=1 Tax=metagenome TaxID=256318 RepID=A0A2P2C2Q6_9ZZZZ
MSALANVVYVLTALAALVVVLTRLRLARDEAAGTFRVGHGLVNLHTVTGIVGLAVWVVFLVADEESAAGSSLVGIIGLFFWWVTALLGLMVLMRWLPTRGRHADDRPGRSWSTWITGPGFSLLAHLGVLLGVGVATWAYLTQAV